MIQNDKDCNAKIENYGKNSNGRGEVFRLCKRNAKWKVVMKYGTYYLCTYHKNRYDKYKSFIKCSEIK